MIFPKMTTLCAMALFASGLLAQTTSQARDQIRYNNYTFCAGMARALPAILQKKGDAGFEQQSTDKAVEYEARATALLSVLKLTPSSLKGDVDLTKLAIMIKWNRLPGPDKQTYLKKQLGHCQAIATNGPELDIEIML